MPVLKNQKHEKFAQYLATGMSATEAYSKVYKKKGRVAESAGARLLRNVAVSTRLTELQQKAAEKAVLTLERKREILHEIAEGKRPSKTMKTAKGTVEIYESVKALELDAKLAGEFKEKVEVQVDGLGELLRAIRGGK